MASCPPCQLSTAAQRALQLHNSAPRRLNNANTGIVGPLHSRRTQQHRCLRPAATAGSKGGAGDGDDVDIDVLAARLAAEAERLRRAGELSGAKEEEDDLPTELPTSSSSSSSPSSSRGGGGEASTADMLSPFGYESKAVEAEILAAVGDGGFSAQEFELQQELGTINIQQVEAVAVDLSASLDASGALGEQRRARPAVIAFSAVFYSGMPFQDPVLTLVKEYLPGAKAVACNELQVLAHLTGMPGPNAKWEVAAAALTPSPPVVPLLGYFVAGQSQRAQQLGSSSSREEDAIWVVLKWEGLAPLTLYPSAQQTSGIGLGRLFGGQAKAVQARWQMIRAIARGSLEALAYCHDRSVVHGAVGSGSVMLSTFSDSSASRLIVKLDNFGFARKISGGTGGTAGSSSSSTPGGSGRGQAEPPAALFPQPQPALPDDTPLALGKKEDLRALAVVLLECLLSALARSGPSQLSSADSIQRLLGDVFQYSLPDFESYCRDEPEWEEAVQLLDERDRAGWELLAALLDGRAAAGQLAQGSRFCQPA